MSTMESTLESTIEKEGLREAPENGEKPDVGLKNGKSFEVIYEKFYSRCYALCFKILENKADAEDVAQIAMIRIMQKIDTFEGRSTLSTWIRTVVWNEIMGFLRKDKRNSGVILASPPDKDGVDESDPESIVLRKEMFELVMGSLEHGNMEYKNAAKLQLLEGLTDDEIFEKYQEMETRVHSKATIKSRIFRVRMELKAKLIKRGYGEHLKK